MKKILFTILVFGFSLLQALSYDEMIRQKYIEPSSVDCKNAEETIKVLYLCWSNLVSPYSQQIFAIKDNFYSSYYKILIEHINTQDKHKIDDMVKNMLAKQDECEEMASNIDLPEGANPIIPSLELYSCMQDEYGKSFQELSNFIYDNPKYKHIFDEIFAPNPKEYYELIKSNSNSEFLLENILQKAAQDNLIDKTGKLIDRVDSK